MTNNLMTNKLHPRMELTPRLEALRQKIHRASLRMLTIRDRRLTERRARKRRGPDRRKS